jgi:hypothetical protein
MQAMPSGFLHNTLFFGLIWYLALFGSERFFRLTVKNLLIAPGRPRWTREPGWQATVHDLPGKLSGGLWNCSFTEVGSDTRVWAITAQDVSMLRRGDSVTVSGRISGISSLEYISLEDAIVRGDNVPFP